MNQHHLKVWPEPFAALVLGLKTAEYRYVADRRFEVGDLLILEEYEAPTQTYTGRVERRVITRIDRGPDFGIRQGFGMISFLSESEGPLAAVRAALEYELVAR